ncbi:MAG: DUF1697 domain-containing protein [Labilithrix sp.]|nr:DUF1697 domain-containing protein [Labilithrix sp.]
MASKTSDRHVALLRGINVGGNNIIKMVDLRVAFEAMGFAEVATYIQSGNVVFSSRPAKKAALTTKIEAALGEAFGYASRVVVLTANELARVVAEAPEFGKRPSEYRYDVLFVKEPVTPGEALAQITAKPGVDAVHAGAHAIYFRRLIRRATQSRLAKIAQQPVYKSLTIRNWNTTVKLLGMVS